MTTLADLAGIMASFNAAKATGSETTEWADFTGDCHTRLGMAPWDDRAEDTPAPEDMADYWRDVAEDG